MKCFKINEQYYGSRYIFEGYGKFEELVKLGLPPEDIQPKLCSLITLCYVGDILSTKIIKECVDIELIENDSNIIFYPKHEEYNRDYESSIKVISTFLTSKSKSINILFIDGYNGKRFREIVNGINKLKTSKWYDSTFKDMLKFIAKSRNEVSACNICNLYYYENFFGSTLRYNSFDCWGNKKYTDILLGNLSYRYSNMSLLSFNDDNSNIGKNYCIDSLKYSRDRSDIEFLEKFYFEPDNSISDALDRYYKRGDYKPKPYVDDGVDGMRWYGNFENAWSKDYGKEDWACHTNGMFANNFRQH